MSISGGIPRADSTNLYRIQVGSYREAENAEKTFNMLRDAGLSPAYESYLDLRRVVLPGISARFIPVLLDVIRTAGFDSIWIREDSGELDTSAANIVIVEVPVLVEVPVIVEVPVVVEVPVYIDVPVIVEVPVPAMEPEPAIVEEIPPVVNIVVNSGGAVTEINPSVTGPLEIIQTIPSFTGSDTNSYQANAPIVFFFNNKIFLDSVEGNIEVAADGKLIDGTAVIDEGANGFAVLVFTPDESFEAGKEISVTIRKDLQNDGGNPMEDDLNLLYVAEKGSETEFSGNFGFESGELGVVFTGDGAIGTAIGDLVPYEGSYYAAISTGAYIVSETGAAIGNRTSQIQLGPILEPFTSISFYYDFASEEFNNYVGSLYDDTAMVTVYGPAGTYTEIITSVNAIGYDNLHFQDHPKLPFSWASYAGHTGWKYFKMENLNVGSPAYIIFSITDVGDDAMVSLLAIDAIKLE